MVAFRIKQESNEGKSSMCNEFFDDNDTVFLYIFSVLLILFLSIFIELQPPRGESKYTYIDLQETEAMKICGSRYRNGNYKLYYRRRTFSFDLPDRNVIEVQCNFFTSVDITDQPKLIARELINHGKEHLFDVIYDDNRRLSPVNLMISMNITRDVFNEKIDLIEIDSNGVPEYRTKLGSLREDKCSKFDFSGVVYNSSKPALSIKRVGNMFITNIDNINNLKINKEFLVQKIKETVFCSSKSIDNKIMKSWS